ncbi:BPI fold-containing family B member 1-like [Ornithorhynchus anatinus]|uniref:BPI fold-containing family B member 1-like n=1 Tax=Ornithorhynchus anatinus TaxID=9258 RepID=UPI0010A75E32|nr:BPI fold-containing family B member 1-like [Ornithorhynchus anatinus]
MIFPICGLALLWGLFSGTAAQTTRNVPADRVVPPNTQAVLNLGPDVLKEALSQALRDHDAVKTLKDLPLLSEMENAASKGFLGSLVSSFLKQIVWMKVTNADILPLQLEQSEDGQGLTVKIPLDLVAGIKTPLSWKVIELHMLLDVVAEVGMGADGEGRIRLQLGHCGVSKGSLRVSLLDRISFMANRFADRVIDTLVPAFPQLVKRQFCPVISEAFIDLSAKLLSSVKAPVSVGSSDLVFEVLSSTIVDKGIQVTLGALLKDGKGLVNQVLNPSGGTFPVPQLGRSAVNMVVGEDVVNGVLGATLPPEAYSVRLNSVLPDLGQRLKSDLIRANPEAVKYLNKSEILKVTTQEAPVISLKDGSANVAQLNLIELFTDSQAHRPLFTLGVESSSEGQFFTDEDKVKLNLKGIKSDRIHLLKSDIGLFRTDQLKDIVDEILTTVLLPTQNAKIGDGIPTEPVKRLGFDKIKVFPVAGALLVTPASLI